MDPGLVRAPRLRPALPLLLGAAAAAGTYIWAKTISPDYTTSLFGQKATNTFPIKSWIATVVLLLAVVQLYTALWLFGKINRTIPRPRRLGLFHRLTGATALLLSVPVAYHCLFAYGFRHFDTRTAVHSIAGCFFWGAVVTKIVSVRTKGLPGWLLPVAGGTLVSTVAVLWYSSALWYFNDSSVPLLGGSPASKTAPSYGGAPAAPGSAVNVSMANIQFAPRQITVKPGQTVVWTNRDSVVHNVTATGGATFRSANFGQGGSFRWRAAKPGTVVYVCTIHPGMGGTITVTATGAPAAPAPTPAPPAREDRGRGRRGD